MKEISEVEIETFVQATEDEEKVVNAVENIIPPEMRTNGKDLARESVKGVFHNPITIIRLKYLQDAKKIVEFIAQNLSKSDKQYLLQTLNQRIDKNHFFLRFGKQELSQGRIEIKEIRDVVKVRVSFTRNYSARDKIIALLQEVELI